MSQQIPAASPAASPIASKEENLKKLKSASLFVSTIGGLILLCGGFACATARGPEAIAVSLVVLLVGAIYFFLGFIIKRRSVVALYAATGLTLIILLLSLLARLPVVLLVSIVLLFRLISTLSVIDALK